MNRLSHASLVTLVLAALLFTALPSFSQVVRIGGGASTIADTQGAAVTVYQADATTQSSLGYAQGVHLGGSREVRNGAGALTVGDSNITLDLPTDLAGGGRAVSVRGVLMQTLDDRRAALGSSDNLLPAAARPRVSAAAFAGWTGDGYRNAFFSSVATTHPIAFAVASMALTRSVDLSAIAVRGSQSSMLASAAWQPRPHTMAAMTLGISAGKPLLRVAAHSSGATWHADTNYTSTALHLQPEPTLASLSLERIGWNMTAGKRIGTWLSLDAARHEFATADARDSVRAGISAGRSTLYEGGATVHLGHAEAGGRAMHSISGPQKSGGYVLIAGWNERRWNVRGTSVTNLGADGTTTRSATIDTTERVTTRLRLTQGTSFANGAPSFDFGGAYENRHGSLTVSHQETYVPFGNQMGFHRVLAVGIRLHMGNSEIAADTIRGGGLQNAYDLTIDSFHGDTLGSMGGPASHMASMPRYAVRGRVLTEDGAPVRGAAVVAGTQTVYTDSEGRFLARFAGHAEVRVRLDTAAFLTPESYRNTEESHTITPQPEGSAEVLELKVQRCNACTQELQLNTPRSVDEPVAPVKKRPALLRVGAGILTLAKRMFTLRPSHRSEA